MGMRKPASITLVALALLAAGCGSGSGATTSPKGGTAAGSNKLTACLKKAGLTLKSSGPLLITVKSTKDGSHAAVHVFPSATIARAKARLATRTGRSPGLSQAFGRVAVDGQAGGALLAANRCAQQMAL
jgi:hypothetical protein